MLQVTLTHHEGGVVSQGQQPQPHAVQDVDHARHPSVRAESHQAGPVSVHDLLVVNQPDSLPAQHKHPYNIRLNKEMQERTLRGSRQNSCTIHRELGRGGMLFG